MSQRQFIFIQLVLELAIPVLGYFFWKWDTTFILLFYALDWLTAIAFNFLKTFKRLAFTSLKNERKQALIHHSIALFSFLGTLGSLYLVLKAIVPHFSLSQRFMDFLAYEDMGIAQGYVLIPLLVLSGYSAYKREFLLPKLHERKSVKEIHLTSSLQNSSVLIASLLFFGITCVTAIEPEVILFSCMFGVFAGKLYFQLFKKH